MSADAAARDARFFDVDTVIHRRRLAMEERPPTEDERAAMEEDRRISEQVAEIGDSEWYQNFRNWIEEEREALLGQITAEGNGAKVEILTLIRKRLDTEMSVARERLNVRAESGD